MKIEAIRIRDFRAIENLDLDFRDDFGLIRDRVPIVGPNTSGKTTILNAIALSLMPLLEVNRFREGLRLTPASIVRRGAIRASVTNTVWFSDEELEATRRVMELAGRPFKGTVPQTNHVTVEWTYPDPNGENRAGLFRCDPPDGKLLFLGRAALRMYRHAPMLRWYDVRRLGQVVLFDQQRTGLAKHLHPQEWDLLGHLTGMQATEESSRTDLENAALLEPIRPFLPQSVIETSDPRLILTSLAMRAQVRQDPGATEREDFDRLCMLYKQVCRPHKIGGLYNTDHGLDIEFHGERGVYYYDGLSSGQQMILLLLLQFATRRIHRSIVLIDELELHLHPLWQDRLYSSLAELGDDNQFLFTTHSTHLRDSLQEPFHSTGELLAGA